MDNAKSRILSTIHNFTRSLTGSSLVLFERFVDAVLEQCGEDAGEFVNQVLLACWRDDGGDVEHIAFDHVPDHIPGRVIELANTILGNHWSCWDLVCEIVKCPTIPKSQIALLPFSVSSTIASCHFMTLVRAQSDPVDAIAKWLDGFPWEF